MEILKSKVFEICVDNINFSYAEKNFIKVNLLLKQEIHILFIWAKWNWKNFFNRINLWIDRTRCRQNKNK